MRVTEQITVTATGSLDDVRAYQQDRSLEFSTQGWQELSRAVFERDSARRVWSAQIVARRIVERGHEQRPVGPG